MAIRTFLFALGFLLLATPARAESWVGRCNGLEFHFNRKTRKAVVYMRTPDGIFQMTSGEIAFDNGSALRAPLAGVPDGSRGPMTEIGLNKSRGIVYILYRHPSLNQTKDGIFCETPITVEP